MRSHVERGYTEKHDGGTHIGTHITGIRKE